MRVTDPRLWSPQVQMGQRQPEPLQPWMRLTPAVVPGAGLDSDLPGWGGRPTEKIKVVETF